MEIENPAVGFSQFFWYYRRGICDNFCDAFATRPTFPCKPRPSCTILPTFLTLTLTPHFRRTQLYHHLVTMGSVNFLNGLFQIDITIYWLPHWFLNLAARRRRQVLDERSVKFLIRWSPEQSITKDAEMPIDGHKLTVTGTGPCIFQIPYIKIHLFIDWSILWSNRRTKRTEGHISMTAYIRKHYLPDI